jgi:Polyketide cyclase / dehydrase and lipid transport
MRSNTQTVSIDSPADRAFAFVADPSNLPRWAIGFAKDVNQVKQGGDLGYVVTTGQGEVPLRVATDARLGVVDFHMTVADGADAVARSRVLPRGDGAEYVFTQFQAPGMADAVFEGQVAALGHELVALKALLEVECPL